MIPTAVPPPTERRPVDDGRRVRARWALVLGLASAPLLVVAVLGATWVAGADGTVPPPSTAPPPVEELDVDEGVAIGAPRPEAAEGATPFCRRAVATVTIPEGTELSLVALVGILADVDFEGLLEVAPPDLIGPLETVRDGQADLAGALAAAGADGRVRIEDLDPAFVDALTTVATAVVEDCGVGG